MGGSLDQSVQGFMQSRHGQARSLYQAVQSTAKHPDMDEIEFQQRVQDGLSSGRFALLIVGDQIYPGATQLVEMIESAPHLQFTMGLVELRCYRQEKEATWPLIVVPRFVAKTKEVTRAVVKVLYEEKKPEVTVVTPIEPPAEGRTSPEEFVAALPSAISDMFASFIDRWTKSSYTLYWGKVGFSLRINWKGRLRTIFDAYPTYASILQDKRVAKEELPPEPHQEYKAELMTSSAISRAFAGDKRYINYTDLTTDDVLLLLNSTDKLAEAICSAAK